MATSSFRQRGHNFRVSELHRSDHGPGNEPHSPQAPRGLRLRQHPQLHAADPPASRDPATRCHVVGWRRGGDRQVIGPCDRGRGEHRGHPKGLGYDQQAINDLGGISREIVQADPGGSNLHVTEVPGAAATGKEASSVAAANADGTSTASTGGGGAATASASSSGDAGGVERSPEVGCWWGIAGSLGLRVWDARGGRVVSGL